jgi:hypothetical protein
MPAAYCGVAFRGVARALGIPGDDIAAAEVRLASAVIARPNTRDETRTDPAPTLVA